MLAANGRAPDVAAGGFAAGDTIELLSQRGGAIGKGLASVDAAVAASRARGLEVVHRDRLVLY